MKKVLLSMLVLLSTVAMQAQNWTAPSENDYPSETPIYVQVNINGDLSNEVEVAAFIDGACRAAATEATINTDAGNMFALRVRGGDDDMNKAITFKVFDRNYGIVYSLKKQATFTGETVSEVPFVLNVDRPVEILINHGEVPLQIETKLPARIDLNEYLELTYYGVDSQGNSWTEPRGESEIETQLKYTWKSESGEDLIDFTIDENNILRTTQARTENVMLTLGVPGYQEICTSFTQIEIIEQVTPVTGITCSMQTVKMNKGENLYDIEELINAIVVEPADASNKNYYFELANAEDAGAIEKGIAMRGGTYEVKIVSDYDPQIFTTITVEVYAPVEYLRVTQQSFHAALGENIYDLIAPYVAVGPEDATDKSFSLQIPQEAADAFTDNVAFMPGEYVISVVSNDNPEISSDVTVVVTQIIAPEEINVEINTNVYDILRSQVVVIPENKDGESYTITPADEETANAIINEYATKNGEYTLIVTSTLNKNVSVEVKVIVTTPIDITFPEQLTISKYKDTEFVLTMTGDDFDPELVELEFTKTTDPANFGIPTSNSNDGLVWNIRATGSGSVELRIKYNGEYMPRGSEGSTVCYVEIPVEITFNNNGWDWIYAPAQINLMNNAETTGSYLEQLNIDENNRVIEIRSQRELLYNDPVYGFLGQITTLNSYEGMYKIKASYADASNCILTSSQNYWDRYPQQGLAKPGYTWIGYPNEWDMTIDELNTLGNQYITATEGDQIIGKTSFAEYSEGAWVGADFTLEAGKGYIYYNNSESDLYISFDYIPDFSNQTYNLYETKSKLTARTPISMNSVWGYDAGQFADNMAIVAQVADLDNPEDYTIGAFVNGECRGMGKVVKDGKMMINVAGKTGETVTFRLHNEYTGEYIDVNSAVDYAQKLGSLKSPATLVSNHVSGISTIVTDENNDATYYDLNGRIVEGNISNGVYVVKTVENGQVVVKKVIKK